MLLAALMGLPVMVDGVVLELLLGTPMELLVALRGLIMIMVLMIMGLEMTPLQ